MDASSQFDVWQLTALAAALGWASGIRLYAVLFIVGGLGFLNWIELPGGLAVLAHPWVLTASGFMFFVEFFADKIPGVDTLWDAVHTFIRIPAGAALAASVFGDSSAGGVDDAQCLHNLVGADPGRDYQAVVTVLDVAGNPSSPSPVAANTRQSYVRQARGRSS